MNSKEAIKEIQKEMNELELQTELVWILIAVLTVLYFIYPLFII